MGFELIKKDTLLIEPVEINTTNLVLVKNIIPNYALVRYQSKDIERDYVGRMVLFIDGIIDAKQHFDHNVEGKVLTEIKEGDIIGIL